MAHFCVVAPVHVLDQLRNRHTMGRHHLLLAHDVAAHASAYRKAFEGIHPHPFSFVIMDNSVVELKQAVDLNMIVEACDTVKPSCVVLPDVLEDCDATITSCKEALLTWSQVKGLRGIPFMLCPQGRTLEEFTMCAEVFAQDPNIGYWGCPRNLVRNIGTRQQAIQVLNLLNHRRPIHMLGFSDDFIDDILCARRPLVYSIDSAVPLRCATPFTLTTKMPPRGNWWAAGQVTTETVANLNRVRIWCNGSGHASAAA